MSVTTTRLLTYICLACFGIAIAAHSRAQAPVKYGLLQRGPSWQVSIRLPEPATLQPVSLPAANTNVATQPAIADPLLYFNTFNSRVQQQNNQLMQQHHSALDSYKRQQILAEMEQDIKEAELRHRYNQWLQKSGHYRDAYARLQQLNPDSFSITRAVYIVENAFMDNRYSFATLQARLRREAAIIRQQLKKEKLDTGNDLVLNYGIQNRFSRGGQYYDAAKKQTVAVKPFTYDFTDYMGKADYRQMFATKMLATGKGQCHSMPLVYLMIAEQLGARAWLSLAPEHSFIKFTDARGNLLNFETTNGNLVSDNWLHQSGYINAHALKNRIYLDTLSQRQLYAQCLADLLQGYLKKFPYDNFAETIRRRILQLHPDNLAALMIDAGVRSGIALQLINAAGKPPEDKLHQYPQAYAAYQHMHAAYQRIDDLGYQEMPAEAYRRWLKSVEQEKKKQENQELQQRVKKEIEQLKKDPPRSVVIPKPIG